MMAAPIIPASIAVLFLIFSSLVIKRRRKYKMNTQLYMEKWLELQKNCASRKTWPQAIVEADALLDQALICRGYKGRTTGERLVAAQRALSNNESVWFGHKYCQSVLDKDVRKLRKQDILEALHGFRQALRDLGALELPEVKND